MSFVASKCSKEILFDGYALKNKFVIETKNHSFHCMSHFISKRWSAQVVNIDVVCMCWTFERRLGFGYKEFLLYQ